MKFTEWNGENLQGAWLISEKLDGIQGRKRYKLDHKNPHFISKNGKSLNNLPKELPEGSIFEIYNGNCHSTWSVISGPEGEREQIKPEQVFQLWPNIDDRLILKSQVHNPTKRTINHFFQKVLKKGGEGLVLRNLNNPEECIKVKESYTIDTKIIGFVEGKGKFKDMLGKSLTEHGGVGIGKGLTMEKRKQYWRQKKKLLNTFIEVKCMHMTANNKFFQPRLVKLRPDK